MTVRWLLGASLLFAACASPPSQAVEVARSTTNTTLPATTMLPTTTTLPATTTLPTTTTSAAPTRSVIEPAWTPFATAGDIVLTHPASRLERIGFHESNHEGAQQLTALPTAVSPAMMEGRGRLTSAATAADVVIDPAAEVRSPVSGSVKSAGRYVLYCKHSDDFVVIAPDAHPTWEVKILHINGVRVSAGDRVEAGVTVLAPGPTQLPFQSQVDELRTIDPAWPHVHIEVVDPSIKNIPSPGGGC